MRRNVLMTATGLLLIFAPMSAARSARLRFHGALRVLAAQPTGTAAGDSPLTITLSRPLPAKVPPGSRPRLSPDIAGRWSEPTPDTLRFTPYGAYTSGTHVTVTVPARLAAADGAHLRAPYKFSFTAGAYSDVRLVQLLAQLDYLPVRLASSLTLGNPRAQIRAAYTPPPGRLTVGPGWPAELRRLWTSQRALVIAGGIRAFEAQHNMTMDGIVSPQLWTALLQAADRQQRNTSGYTYAIASERSPETLTVWHNGAVVLRSLANTGVAGSPTQPGTYPVYEKLQAQVMRGTNLNGSPYADQVYWVSYFHGGDAVHWIARASYGWPQSLGCVELPWNPAKTAYGYLTYGSLVTVNAA